MISEDEKRIAVRKCNEDDTNALRWCIAKPNQRKSRKMTCHGFTELLYDLMGWDKKCRYKILGYRIEFNGNTYYVFDLTVPQRFREKPKKGEIEEILESGGEPEKIDTRK